MGKWYSMNQTSWKDESCILLQLDNNHTQQKKNPVDYQRLTMCLCVSLKHFFRKPLLKNFQEGKLGY